MTTYPFQLRDSEQPFSNWLVAMVSNSSMSAFQGANSMTEEFDCDALVAEHRGRLLAKFRSPNVRAFEDAFGVSFPASLHQLYSLGEALIESPIALQCAFIQSIAALTDTLAQSGKRYRWRFHEFAVGPDGESLLYAMDGSDVVHVDHAGDGSDVEPTDISYAELLRQLKGKLKLDCE